MKFHLATAPGLNLFSGYGEGYVAVNGVRHETEPGGDAGAHHFAVGRADFRGAGARALRVSLPVSAWRSSLLGTGARLRFPPVALQRIVLQARTGLETMDAMAACRTYNILAAEGRKVAAAIVLR